MAHEQMVSDEMKRLLAESTPAASGEDSAFLRIMQRRFDLNTKIPTELVEKKSHLSAVGHELWVEARQENNFEKFRPVLEQMFELARQEAEHLGYKEHIYDALLDQYEEGATRADAQGMFDTIRKPLKTLLDRTQAATTPDDSFLFGEWDNAKQKQFTEMLVQAIGFDFNRGRQDTAPHPFCTGWSVGDIRITTRFKPDIGSAIFGSLHEAGHGMYEQGSPMAWDRTPLAGGVSLGVHESQSRLWENIVGRSNAFWSYFYPKLQATFPEFKAVPLDKFIKGINKIQPSLIRVEADEVTYNFHIMIRFELECAILTGELKVKDLPEAWKAKYKEYLGVTPPNDSEGCLQDVHWSGGMIGYFPTYSMGNLLSYQIWDRLSQDIPDTECQMASGDFSHILKWLQEHIYSQGSLYTPRELVKRVTGKPMGADDYVKGITAKYEALYGLSPV